jgi:uncharacterized protein
MAANNEIERRFASEGMELRKDGDKPKMVVGYACRFDSIYDMHWMSEEVSPDAFSGIDLVASDCVCLFNHDSNVVLGRTSAGTLRLKLDEKGLFYECDLPDSPNGQNIGEAVSRGDVKASSWAFTVSDDEWSMKDGKDHRLIKKIKRLYDVSPVTYPANPATDVAARSLAAVKGGDDDEFFKKNNQGEARKRDLDMMKMASEQ